MTLTYTHNRAAWLQGAQWLPDAPPFPAWPSITRFVIHWPGADGAIDGDPGESADQLDNYLRNIQSTYVRNRGYNIGYNVAFDWLGGTWELRGSQYRCAANKGLNEFTYAGLVLTDLDGAITAQCIHAIQKFNEQLLRENPRITIMGHGEGPKLYPELKPTPTACPGPLKLLVADGTFSKPPVGPGLPPAPPPLPIAGTYKVVAGDGWFLISRKVGVDVGRILAVNPPATLMSPLHIGQQLKVPKAARSYMVRSGDGFFTIARALGMPTHEVSYDRLRVQLRYYKGRVVPHPGDVLSQ